MRLSIDVGGLSSVERTALLTLYARALDSRSVRPILGDTQAETTVAALDYDFGSLRVRPSVGAPVVMRARVLDDHVRAFVDRHPHAVVVDLGAGFSTAALRCRPPGTVDWYSVTLPGVIALRARLFPTGPHVHDVAARIGTSGWTQALPSGRPTMLLADGLTGFLSEPDLIAMFRDVTAHFVWGELAFNDYGPIGRISRVAMKLIPQGTGNAFANNGFRDAEQPQRWNPQLRLAEELSLAAIPEAALLPGHLRAALRFPSFARKWPVLRFRFLTAALRRTAVRRLSASGGGGRG